MRATLAAGRDAPKGGGGGLPGCSFPPPPQTPQNQNLRNKFCRHDDRKMLRDLPFCRNQALKSAVE